MNSPVLKPILTIPLPKWTTATQLGFGLAIGLSWHLNHSYLWAGLHGLLSWVYLSYKAAPWVAGQLGLILR